MITITNPKLESFTPQWARFHGFSLLFDNPGASLRDDNSHTTLVTDPQIEFYAALKQTLQSIGEPMLTNSYLFAPLPYPSYHVTVWDGINDSNLADVNPKHRHDATTLISGLPSSLASKNALTQFIAASSLLQNQAPLTFSFDSLQMWGNKVLVATLCPTEESLAPFDTLKLQRANHSHSFAAEFGTAPLAEYRPHVSLGYFANKELAETAINPLTAWQAAFSKSMAQKTISFSSLSLYGFTNMATFIKAKP